MWIKIKKYTKNFFLILFQVNIIVGNILFIVIINYHNKSNDS